MPDYPKERLVERPDQKQYTLIRVSIPFDIGLSILGSGWFRVEVY